jgi:hypothetical protein
MSVVVRQNLISSSPNPSKKVSPKGFKIFNKLAWSKNRAQNLRLKKGQRRRELVEL